jgi:hypothetical protein
MKRRQKTLFSLGCASLLQGCSTTVNFYPIEGPLSQIKPLPLLQAKADGILGNTGTLTLSLHNGEVCTGKWSSLAPTFAATSSGTLFDRYGRSIGFQGSVIGIQPGVNRGAAFLTCSAGTTIEAEFLTGSGTANGVGVAKDSAGNVYRMLF